MWSGMGDVLLCTEISNNLNTISEILCIINFVISLCLLLLCVWMEQLCKQGAHISVHSTWCVGD